MYLIIAFLESKVFREFIKCVDWFVITCILPSRLISGTVRVKPNITEVTETGVKFEDGSFEDDIDVIMLATGYIFGFPFLDKDVIEVKENNVKLFKYMFPPELEKPTLAVIGCIQPIGAIMPISELQCRLAARVFKVPIFRFCLNVYTSIKNMHDILLYSSKLIK